MTFLPIVTRELRIASRRKSTYRLRAWSATLAFGVSCLSLLIAEEKSTGPAMMGTLSVGMLILALMGGVFLGADCLSQERREGTLGFLFLTDLKGYDIVLGKFVAVILNAFYGLVAIFPILALCLLMGGVTGAEFWRTCLALGNAMFFSVATALWVSSRSVTTSRSLVNSFAILVLMLMLSIFARSTLWTALSPITAFGLAKSAGHQVAAKLFWQSLAFSHLTGWAFLGLASWRLKFFRENQRSSIFTSDLLSRWRKRRRKNLDINPIVWLMDDSQFFRWGVWGLVMLGTAFAIISAKYWPNEMFFMANLGSPFNFVLKFFFAIQACRFFSEARQSGALEMLCGTPLSMRGLVFGQWAALKRMFLVPTTAMVAIQTVVLLFARPRPLGEQDFMILLVAGKFALNNIADFWALGWFGMWSALTFRKPSFAVGATILCLLVLPTIFYCVPTLLVDVALGLIAHSKLKQEFSSHLPVRVYVPGK